MSEQRHPSSTSLTSALSEAHSIIEAAEKRAAELTEEAKKKFEEAWNEGYHQGFEQGRREASKQAIRLIQESTAVSDRLAEEAAHLALAIAESVISEHVKVEQQTVKRMAINAIQESVIGDSVTIISHPQDQQVLANSINELRQIAGGAGVLLETNSALTRGGCIVRTDFGEVDASIEALLESIRERLGLADHGR